jgi:dienelactone hydrolase
MTTYRHLGVYSDLVDAAKRQRPLYPVARPGEATQAKVRERLGFCSGPEAPLNVQMHARWERDGVEGELVSWSVGYGPRTEAYVLKPAGVSGPLPGVLALHDHGGFKFYGKEKIADGPDGMPAPLLQNFRDGCYGGRAYANELAREGFVVVAHDTFLWGSRKFPVEDMPADLSAQAGAGGELAAQIQAYNAAAGPHEHLVAKYCNLLGTGMPGVVCFEDRVALNYLRSRAEVAPERVACLGLSGGGNRSAMLAASHGGLKAAAIVGLMTTYEGVLDHNVYSHTWMLYPYGMALDMDWSDLAACRAPLPLLVQYDEQDDLFTPEGMRAAHARLSDHYAWAGAPDAYVGQWYPGPHKFDLPMQRAAFDWLKANLEIS